MNLKNSFTEKTRSLFVSNSTKKRLLRATYKYLMEEGYKLTDKDREFMRKYKEYYQEED